MSDAMRSFGDFKKLCENVVADQEQSAGKIAALARATADASLRAELEKEYEETAAAAEAATADLELAQAALEDSDTIRDEKGTPVSKTRRFYLQNNPKAAREHEAKKQDANDALAAAQATIDDSTQRLMDLEAQLASEDPLGERGRQESERAMQAMSSMETQDMGSAM